MQKLSLLFRPVIFSVVLILMLVSTSYSRPFDWYYTRLSAPFAVFYNPALIGNNPGYTFAVDGRHIDSINYDIRGAIVIPVSRVMKFEDHIRLQNSSKYFRYSNTSHRSSAMAVSVGGMYFGDESYKISTGFVTQLRSVGSGMSFDFLQPNNDENPTVSMNAAISTDVPRVMRDGVLRLAFHNLIVSEKTDYNQFGFSIGTGGVAFADPRMYHLPYDLLFHFYMMDGKIDRVEGLARVTFDMTYLHTSSGTSGQSVTGAVGYNYVRRSSGAVYHKFFATLGVVFLTRTSSLAVIGGYGEGNEKYGTAFFNSFKKSAVTESDFYATVRVSRTEDGKVMLNIGNGGTETVKSWVIRIDDQRGGSIRTFSGGNVLPSSVIWDGLNANGNPVNEELIYIKLVLHSDQRVVESEPVVIERSAGDPLFSQPSTTGQRR